MSSSSPILTKDSLPIVNSSEIDSKNINQFITDSTSNNQFVSQDFNINQFPILSNNQFNINEFNTNQFFSDSTSNLQNNSQDYIQNSQTNGVQPNIINNKFINTSILSQPTFESKNYKNETTNDENEANLRESENDIFSSPVTFYLPKIYEDSNPETQSQPNLGFNSYHIEQQQTFINNAVIPKSETRFSFTLYPKNEEDQNTRFSFTLFPNQEITE